MDEAMEARLTELEIKMGYAEDLLETLNRTVFHQQEQLGRLEQLVAQLARQVRESAVPQARDLQDEIPPHY